MEREETIAHVVLASPPPAVVLPSPSPPPSSSLEVEEEGRLKSLGDTAGDASTASPKTGWANWRKAACIATLVILLLGLTGTILWCLYIGNHRTYHTSPGSIILWTMLTKALLFPLLLFFWIIAKPRIEVLAVICVNLALFACSVGLSCFGICAIWKENTTLIEAYFWLFLLQWFLELGSVVALLVVIYPDEQPAESICPGSLSLEDCDDELMANNIAIMSSLSVHKLIGVCALYLLHHYRRDVLQHLQASRAEAAEAAAAAERAQKNPLILRWLRRTSSSSFSSLFERGSKWWTGFEIPTIKIDLASDDSSASAYSSADSAGFRSQQFGLPPPPPGGVAPAAEGTAAAVATAAPPASHPQAHIHTNGLSLPVLGYRHGR
ncbi:hypothetical protein FS842_002137 [Serendipita sp. 407]|nr:hypothetical protein FS842_002137 [Serendipita sp. 407]